MLAHTPNFESLAVAPVKQTDVLVVRQIPDETGYVDDTLVWDANKHTDGFGATTYGPLMDVKIDAVGQMLGTATKKAVVNLQKIQDSAAIGDVFQIRTGLYDTAAQDFEYISQGFFIVDDIEFNYDADSTTVTLYDHMWTANNRNYSEYVPPSSIEYPITVEGLAEHMADLLGLTLMSGFDQLPNSSYQIQEDLYSLISGATLRTVIQDIAGATATTARVSDTTLVFSEYDVKNENLDSSSLRTLKIGDTYGPVTSVILGRQPQDDNIALYASDPESNVITAVDTSTNRLTINAHGMPNGNMISLSSTGSLPSPLVPDKHYFVSTAGSEDLFSLAPTYLDAIDGTNLIDLTSAGSGTITITPVRTREIQINNNEILDDDRQELLPPIYNALAGIDWTDVKSDSVGLGWHEVGDVIQFTQGPTTVRAFISEIHLTFAGSIKESLVSETPELAAINYQAAGGILKTLYNTEIKVDKQAQDITSIVSQHAEDQTALQGDLTEIYQNLTNILLTIQNAGGGNLILNSVGYATEDSKDVNDNSFNKLAFWYYNHDHTYPFPEGGVDDPNSLYDPNTMGVISTFSSSESQNAGGISGQVIEFDSDGLIIEQRVDVAVDTSLSFGVRVKKGLVSGSAMITLYNDNESFTKEIEDSSAYEWEELTILDFKVTQPWLNIKIETFNAEQLQITDMRLFYASALTGWVQSNAEILSTNVQFTKNGMRIFDNVHDTETQVTYNEFSTRRTSDNKVLFEADDSGVVTNDLSIKGVTNYIGSDEQIVIRQITIPSSNPMAGIAFVKGS